MTDTDNTTAPAAPESKPDKRCKLTTDQRMEIETKLRSCSRSMASIAREYGVSRTYVRIIAKSLGITYYSVQERASRSPVIARKQLQAEKRAVRAARVQALSAAWLSGKTCQEIAEEFGLTAQTRVAALIARLRDQHGVEKFPYRRNAAPVTE